MKIMYNNKKTILNILIIGTIIILGIFISKISIKDNNNNIINQNNNNTDSNNTNIDGNENISNPTDNGDNTNSGGTTLDIFFDANGSLDLPNKVIDELHLEDIYEEVINSVVTVIIYNNINGKQIKSGSGVVILEDDDNAYVFTNAHVINDSNNSYYIEVVFSNYQRQVATIVGYDYYEDVGILKIDKSDNYTIATFGNSDILKRGQSVFAIGSPLGLGYANSVTSGIITGINSEVTSQKDNESIAYYLIQIDAALNQGNSGGALFNLYGELIGINTIKVTSSNNENVESFNFSLPINHFIFVANEIIENENYKKPLIGITIYKIEELNLKFREEKGIDENIIFGLFISEVNVGSPSDGILNEGDIVIGINDEYIAKDKPFGVIQNKYVANEEVSLNVIRSGVEIKLEITLGEKIRN